MPPEEQRAIHRDRPIIPEKHIPKKPYLQDTSRKMNDLKNTDKMSGPGLTQRPEWQALKDHYRDLGPLPLRGLFAGDPSRFEKFHLRLDGLVFDYSRNNVTEETRALLCALARACDIEGWRGRMLAGEAINATEGRAVLHMALRGSAPEGLAVEGENVGDFVRETLGLIESVSRRVRENPAITDVVNIGIGGTDLGPRMVYRALSPHADGPRLHFVSNVDGGALSLLLEGLKPENTLFIVASKTFTTLETLTNAAAARDWLMSAMPAAEAFGEHFLATTASPEAAEKFGVPAQNILPLREWIGGRYSLWGATGLPVAIACGFGVFEDLLAGAATADRHFISSPLELNIPVLMAMLGIWYRNFHDYSALAVLPYAQNLDLLPAYLQQLDMESNGKGVSREGKKLDYRTGPVIFGDAGTNAQHAFMQLMHQSDQITPADIIAFAEAGHDRPAHHLALFGNALAQGKALMDGLENGAEPHKHFSGGRPSTTLVLDRLDAYHTGLLLALYEHKVFVQGIVWNINSFDQWGVELGKTIARGLIEDLRSGTEQACTDVSTAGLVRHFRERQPRS